MTNIDSLNVQNIRNYYWFLVTGNIEDVTPIYSSHSLNIVNGVKKNKFQVLIEWYQWERTKEQQQNNLVCV